MQRKRVHLPRDNERGATAIEYALMAAFITAVIAAAVLALGTTTLGLFQAGLAAFP